MIEAKPLDFAHKVIRDLSATCLSEGGPVTQEIYELLVKQDYLSVANFNFNYDLCDGSHKSVRDFVMARQIQAFFSKQSIFDFGINKTQVAVDAFVKAENICLETNNRLRLGSSGNPSVDSVMYIAQRKIAECLGDCPQLDTLDLFFGSGATTNVTFDRANIRVKLGSVLQCSSSLVPGVSKLLHEMPPLMDLNTLDGMPRFIAVPGKLNFVPKSYKTYRSIVVEPSLNGIIQKGIGRLLKNKMRNVGVNLRDQTINQKLAKAGSEDGSLATIDLSMASDTLSYGLVLDLLPPLWFDFLNQTRTGTVQYRKSAKRRDLYYLQKFSSMGNGFTFELESMIFWALSYACVDFLGIQDKRLHVFGDDIIVPSDACLLLRDVLVHCGFVINTDKSFWEGNFRESCGADYLFGNDIRPFYLREEFNELTLYKMHNFFVRNGETALAQVVHSFTLEASRLYGPNGYGDGHLLGAFTPLRNRTIRRRGFEGFIFDSYLLRPKKFKLPTRGDAILPGYSIYVKHMSEPSLPDPDDPSLMMREHSLDTVLAQADPLKKSVPSDYNDLRGYSGYYKVSLYSTTRGILFN